MISYCNSQADTNCSQTCNSGYYFARDISQSCHKCSYCCDDEKDEEQPECVRQGLKKSNQHCSHRVDKNCAPDLPTDISSPSSSNGKKQLDLGKTLAIIFGTLVGVLVVVLVVCAIWKRRQSSDQRQISENDAPMIVVDDANNVTTSTCTSQEQNGNIVSQASALHSPTIVSTHQPTAVSRLINEGFVPSNPGTPRVSPDVTPHHTDDELDPVSDHSNKPRKFTRPKKHDSRTGKGQIKIVQQPKSQNQIEGSRVEFSCECQVQRDCQVWYQWLKDGTEFQQQNNASLVLDSVEMRDFGCYRCSVQVTHKGGHREAVMSEPAFLEVAPCEGKRLKCLIEVGNLDYETRDEIASLLEDRTPGLGGYRQIATKYGMKEHQVRGLANSPQPGHAVLEFLRGSKPDLTVYSFCKILKEDNMKRFDIVRVLEDHLSIEKANNGQAKGN